MPRDGSGVYSPPAGSTATPNTTIESAKYNALVADLVTDANAARPITSGGTGETAARLKDGTWRFQNTSDTTKLVALDLSGLTTETTRTISMGDADVTLRPQAWEMISSTAISSASDWRAANLSAYRMLRITGYCRPATDTVSFRLRTSTNNGSSFDSGTSDYDWSNLYGITSGGTPVTDFNEDNADQHVNVGVTTAVGNASGAGLSFEITVHEFNQSAFAQIDAQTKAIVAAGTYSIGTVGGRRRSTTARNAISLFFSSGNIASGFVILEGIRG